MNTITKKIKSIFNRKKERIFYISLHDGNLEEMTYPGYERQPLKESELFSPVYNFRFTNSKEVNWPTCWQQGYESTLHWIGVSLNDKEPATLTEKQNDIRIWVWVSNQITVVKGMTPQAKIGHINLEANQ